MVSLLERSSWSRAEKKPIVIEDLTSKETFDYLHSKLSIEEKVTNQLIQLLGGRIHDLKEYGNMINGGVTFEGERVFTIWIMMMIFCMNVFSSYLIFYF